jgi:hypothetical protein
MFLLDAEAAPDWGSVEKKINENLNLMDASTKHLNDINSYSKVNLERQIKTLNLRHGPIQHSEEHATFPIAMIPRAKNEKILWPCKRNEEHGRVSGSQG